MEERVCARKTWKRERNRQSKNVVSNNSQQSDFRSVWNKAKFICLWIVHGYFCIVVELNACGKTLGA